MRGLEFITPNGYGHILKDILEGVDLQYQWAMTEAFILWGGDSSDSIPDDDCVFQPDEFVKFIGMEDYYPVFIILKAFPLDSTIVELNDFNEYEKSDCQLVIIIADGVYVNLYCKNRDNILTINENAHKLGCRNIEIVTAENDGRTGFHV